LQNSRDRHGHGHGAFQKDLALDTIAGGSYTQSNRRGWKLIFLVPAHDGRKALTLSHEEHLPSWRSLIEEARASAGSSWQAAALRLRRQSDRDGREFERNGRLGRNLSVTPSYKTDAEWAVTIMTKALASADLAFRSFFQRAAQLT